MTSSAFNIDILSEPGDYGAESSGGGTDKRRGLRCAYTVDLVRLGGVDSGISKCRSLVFLQATCGISGDWR